MSTAKSFYGIIIWLMCLQIVIGFTNKTFLGVIDAQGKQPANKFRTTCEDAAFIIRRITWKQEALKLSPNQRTLNEKYKAYLVEADMVVVSIYDGRTRSYQR
jgi:hypothetical protein